VACCGDGSSGIGVAAMLDAPRHAETGTAQEEAAAGRGVRQAEEHEEPTGSVAAEAPLTMPGLGSVKHTAVEPSSRVTCTTLATRDRTSARRRRAWHGMRTRRGQHTL
jgi:hypothetical protein